MCLDFKQKKKKILALKLCNLVQIAMLETMSLFSPTEKNTIITAPLCVLVISGLNTVLDNNCRFASD